jgi:hypothetical protein
VSDVARRSAVEGLLNENESKHLEKEEKKGEKSISNFQDFELKK